MNRSKGILEVGHELDSWVEATHVSHSFLKINACGVVRNDIKLRWALATECFDDLGLEYFFLESRLIEFYLILFVTQLLEGVVEHNIFKLAVSRNCKHAHVTYSKIIFIFQELLVQDNELSTFCIVR